MNLNKYSGAKIARFPAKLESFREGKITAPLYVRIKPTNRCNADCGWCIYNATNSGLHENTGNTKGWKNMKQSELAEIPTDKLLEIIKDLAEMGVKAITFSGGGEPLLHPAICTAASLAHEYGIAFSAITNGQALSGRRAEVFAKAAWVRVSVDYADGKQMAASRGVPERMFDAVMANLKAFAVIKESTCDLEINFIITKENHLSLFDAALALRETGVENIRFSPVWRPDFIAHHSPMAGEVIRQLNRAKAELQTDTFKIYSSYNLSDPQHGTERNHHRCWFMQVTPVIGADQNIYACHQTAYSKHGLLGSIKDRKFSEAWFSPEVKAAMEGLDPIKSCRHHCAASAKNDLIQNIIEAGTDHFV